MVYAYIRVSTEQQCLENQRSEITRFAHVQSLTVNRWVEETVSGKVKGCDRKLGVLLKRMKRGDILLVSELSRLSRTLLEIMSIMRTLLEKGVDLYSSKENCCLGDNINSKVILFAFGLAAEIERDLISMRTREALASRKEQGMPLGRKPGSSPKIESLEPYRDEIMNSIGSGARMSQLCQVYGVSRSTLRRFVIMDPPTYDLT